MPRQRWCGAIVLRCAAPSLMTAGRRLRPLASSSRRGWRKWWPAQPQTLCVSARPCGKRGHRPPRLTRLRHLIGRGLERTAALCRPARRHAAQPRRRTRPGPHALRHGRPQLLARAVPLLRRARPAAYEQRPRAVVRLATLPRAARDRVQGCLAGGGAARRGAADRSNRDAAAKVRPVRTGPGHLGNWKALRQRLDQRRCTRTLRTWFLRDPGAYLAALKQQVRQLTLPA